MKRIALILTTVVLAVAATGCQNWTGQNKRCCNKNKCCNKSNNNNCNPARSCRCSSNNNGSNRNR